MRVLKEPFVQFLLLGALIFLLYDSSRSADVAQRDRSIMIDAPTQEWIYDNFKKQFQQVPTRQEMDALISAYIENEVKYREALAMGLDDRDSIVRRRMMQKFDFLFGNPAADLLPDDDVLQQWYEANSEEFASPPRISFEHLWFSPDTRGRGAEADASASLVALQNNATTEGDVFPFDVVFELATHAEVRNVLGARFTTAVFEAPLNTWSGPVQSGLGYHLVRVSAKTDSVTPPFAEVRESVLQGWRDAESTRLLNEMLLALKESYTIDLDESSLKRFEYAP